MSLSSLKQNSTQNEEPIAIWNIWHMQHLEHMCQFSLSGVLLSVGTSDKAHFLSWPINLERSQGAGGFVVAMEPEITSSCEAPTSVGGQHVTRPIPEVGDNPILTLQELGYYDIMILGLTGQGKTTTADKLLIANPTGVDYQTSFCSSVRPIIDTPTREANMEDLQMWLIPTDQSSLERISTRMKNLAFYRSLENSHIEVNESHEGDMRVNERTLKCELFSNETTRLRVLDVPGFFGAMTAEQVQAATPDGFSPRSTSLVLDTHSTHLHVMRSILHIQTVMKMRFRRILYFLPCRGPLKVISAALQQELQLLVHYFGKSIFQTIVLVATLDFDCMPERVDVKFPQAKLDSSRRTFQQALQIFLPEDTPNPPIIFISLRDTCEVILEKVQQTEVALDGLQLELTPSICARCNMTIGERSGERVAVIKCPDWSQRMMPDVDWDQAMPYEHSRCHPALVPKYKPGQKIAEGIAYTVRAVYNRELEPWPDLSVEKCLHCQFQPGTEGCLKVGTMYNGIRVDHTNKVDEASGYSHRSLIQERRKTSSGSSLPSDSISRDALPSGSEGEDSISSSERQTTLVDGSEIQRRQDIEPNRLARGGATFGGESYQDLFSDTSEGFEQREIIVDIEPGHSPQASLVIGTRLGGAVEGGASNVPEIEVLNSGESKKNSS